LFTAEVNVTLKESILDPQGKTVAQAIHSLGYETISEVRMGKYITFSLNEPSREKAEQKTREICEKLLVNPVMEKYSFVVKS
jgi:phosphoribosylformylglycinamidine synthase subunit PurS